MPSIKSLRYAYDPRTMRATHQQFQTQHMQGRGNGIMVNAQNERITFMISRDIYSVDYRNYCLSVGANDRCDQNLLSFSIFC